MSSVLELEAGDEATWWSQERDGIRELFEYQFGAAIPGSALPEPRDPGLLRERLRQLAPKLATLCDRIRAGFDEQAACAVVVPTLGLADVEVDERRKATFALAALLGDVIANHPMDFAVWDVKERPPGSPAAQDSHSTSTRAANYHTDAGYLPTPPRFFLLYAAQAARCGGGQSLIRDGRVLRDQLAETESGRTAIELLSQKLPRRVPEKFHYVSQVDARGCQFTPVCTDRPSWRWARRNIRVGLETHPEYATPEVWQAFSAVKQLLAQGEEFRAALPSDALLVVENHLAFHARTAFTDPDRHLFRIRFHDPTQRNR